MLTQDFLTSFKPYIRDSVVVVIIIIIIIIIIIKAHDMLL
jgi:hypothetical protein